MAQNLMKGGHKLVVYDLQESAVTAAVNAGAIKAESPSQVIADLVYIKYISCGLGCTASRQSYHYATCCRTCNGML